MKKTKTSKKKRFLMKVRALIYVVTLVLLAFGLTITILPLLSDVVMHALSTRFAYAGSNVASLIVLYMIPALMVGGVFSYYYIRILNRFAKWYRRLIIKILPIKP